MSRIGKQPIVITPDVEVTMESHRVIIRGPKGELELNIHPLVILERHGNEVIVKPAQPDNQLSNSLWGTFQRLVTNMVVGVTDGFEKRLEYKGVGWRTELKNNNLVLHLGYSHPISYRVPDGITVTTDKESITITGIDKQQVGHIAAEIRNLRKPEPYKGKGIKYVGEVIVRKVGKQAKAAA